MELCNFLSGLAFLSLAFFKEDRDAGGADLLPGHTRCQIGIDNRIKPSKLDQ